MEEMVIKVLVLQILWICGFFSRILERPNYFWFYRGCPPTFALYLLWWGSLSFFHYEFDKDGSDQLWVDDVQAFFFVLKTEANVRMCVSATSGF